VLVDAAQILRLRSKLQSNATFSLAEAVGNPPRPHRPRDLNPLRDVFCFRISQVATGPF
jgi:hypothetical protein